MRKPLNTLVGVGLGLTLIEFVRSNLAYYSHSTPELAGRIGNSGTLLMTLIAILFITNTHSKEESN